MPGSRRCAARLVLAIFIVFSPTVKIVPAAASPAHETPGASPAERFALAGTDLSIESTYSIYSLVARNQANVPVRINVRNTGPASILVNQIRPVFSVSAWGDRAADYLVFGTTTPNVIILPGSVHSFDFDITVRSSALTGVPIRIDALAGGYRLDTYETQTDSTATSPHQWTVVAQGINAMVAVFDARLTPDRSDDVLVGSLPGEIFLLNTVHNLNKGLPLANLLLDGSTYYRLVLQLNPSFNWDFEPKDSEKGYIVCNTPGAAIGVLAAPKAGVPELLVTEFFVPNQYDHPYDFVVGTTRGATPAVPWNMKSDPYSAPEVDVGKTGEIANIITASFGRTIIDCRDKDKHWEITGQFESDRYYLYELWFRPDLEWASGSVADISLTIRGNSAPNDIKELHLSFALLDDDSLGPSFGEFDPEIVPADTPFDISCRIWDPSGVHDDDTGSGGQGVYLLWDNDGSLVDGAYEITMSPVGGGFYRTDVPLPGGTNGDIIVYRVHACDDDFDGGLAQDRNRSTSPLRVVQIVSSTYIVDEESSLYPAAAYPGETGFSIRLEFANPMLQAVTLLPASTITISDGAQSVTAALRNETIIPGGARHFPAAFEPVAIPAGFAAPDTLDLVIDLLGLYMTNPYQQRWTASETNRLVVKNPRIFLEAQPTASGTVRPGARNIELLRFELSNESPADALLDSLAVSNATAGRAAPPLSDANMSALRIYRRGAPRPTVAASPGKTDEASDAIETSSAEEIRGILLGPLDSLLAGARLEGGRAMFRFPAPMRFPAGWAARLSVCADVDSLLACDGDSLDIAIGAPDEVFVRAQGAVEFSSSPLDSDGKSVVDGFLPHQLTVEETLPDTLFLGDPRQPVLSFVLPVNGYAPDVLAGLSVKDFAGTGADSLVERLTLWKDDGDGAFEPGPDALVGALSYTGDRFQISGLSVALLVRQRFFVAADFMLGTRAGLVARFGIPEGGVEFASGNDGPIGAPVAATTEQVLVRREIVSLVPRALPTGTRRAGEAGVGLFALEVRNNTLGTVTIDTLRVRGAPSLFSCEPSKPLALHRDDGNGLFDPAHDVRVADSPWDGASALFGDLGLSMASAGSVVLFASADLDSFLTADGESLLVGLDSAEDIRITLGPSVNEEFFRLDASFPMRSAGGAVTDGMLAHEVVLHRHGDSTLVGQRQNILILDIDIPSNACHDDTLTELTVTNLGNAGAKHIERLLLRRDDGDGVFDPALDPAIAQFVEKADRVYEATGFAEPLPAGGARFFVSMDVLSVIETGGTIRAAVPLMGIQVASGHDGPIDVAVESPGTLLIPVPDRVTLFTSIVGNKRVRPGEQHALNLVLGMYNGYQESKTLESLSLLGVGSSRPEEIVSVAAYEDSDRDGLFDPASDRLLETAEAAYPIYTFQGLAMPLEAYRTTVLFIAYSTALDGLRDSVRVDFQVPDKASIGFGDKTVSVQGEFPLNSAGVDVTDGMVSGQIGVLFVANARVSPGAADVPCLSFIVPCNGTVADELRSLALVNDGTAEPVQDIAYVKLWNDAGAEPFAFDPGDGFLGFLGWDGGRWRSISTLAKPISCEGLVLHATADVALMARDGRSIALAVPLNGVTVASGNDGPIDRPVRSPAVIDITTDPLFASILAPAAVTREQLFTVRMVASNVSDTTLRAVAPDSFSWEGSGSLAPVSGPVPAAVDLAAKSGGTFAWTMRGAGAGTIVFRGRALETGGVEASLMERSDTLRIEEIPDNLSVAARDLAPVRVNRGQDDVSLVELSVSYAPASPLAAAVRFRSIELALSDASGGPLAARDVASRLRIKDETRVLGTARTDTIVDPFVVIDLAEPFVLLPGTGKVFRVSIDVPPSAPAAGFRLSIASAAKIALEDRNNGEAVPFTGVAFPWHASVVALDDPATLLLVALEPRLPARVNMGQEGVAAFDLALENAGAAGAAPMSVSAITFFARTSAGDSIDAGSILRSFKLEGLSGSAYATVENFGGRASIRCALEPSLTVSRNDPVTLRARIACAANPAAPGFSIELRDSLDVAARDVNSGRPVDVRSGAGGSGFPMSSGTALFREPLAGIAVSGTGLLAERVAAGASDVPAIRIVLRHPGGAGQSPASLSGFAIRILDELGRGLEPESVLEALRVRSRGAEIASVYVTAAHDPDIVLGFAAPVVTEAGASDTFDVSLRLRASPAAVYFQMHVNAGGLLVTDATDGRSAIPIEGAFPIASGVGRIILPAARALFRADGLLPANVAAGAENGCLRLVFSRPDESSGSRVFVERVVFDVLDERDRPVDPALVVQTMRLAESGRHIETSWTSVEGRLVLAMLDTLALGDGETSGCVLSVATTQSPGVKAFSLRVSGASDIRFTDESTGEPVAAAAASGSFPFGSGRAAILARDMELAFTNYPNPFVASGEKTRITFYMPAAGLATIKVFTVTGEPVLTIVENAPLEAGIHQEYAWDGRNGRGERVLNGVYFLLLEGEADGRTFSFRRKVALVR